MFNMEIFPTSLVISNMACSYFSLDLYFLVGIVLGPISQIECRPKFKCGPTFLCQRPGCRGKKKEAEAEGGNTKRINPRPC